MPDKKVKICHVASADITVKFLLMEQLRFLMRGGYDVYVVCSPGKWAKDIEAHGIKLKTIKITRRITPLSDLFLLLNLFFYFKKEKFDIVHTHTPKPGLIGQMAARLAGVPIVVNTIHGLYFGNKFSKTKKNFYIFIEKISARFSDLIFSQSTEDMATIIDKKIADPKIVKYLGNGVDISKFNSQRFSEDFLDKKRKQLSLPEDYKIIGTVGRLVKEKGYFELFSAFEKVLEKFPKTLLLIIGPEDSEKKDAFSPQVIKEFRSIKSNVFFLGERIDLDELYRLMDVFVLASHREGFPRAIIEAMAMQTPVIATDIRGCREAIENNKNGLLVPLSSPQEIVKQIEFLFENPNKAAELAKNAALKASQDFGENAVFMRIDREYRNLERKKLNYKNTVNKTPASHLKICHVTTVDITLRFIVLGFLRFLKSNNYPVYALSSPGKWESFLENEGFNVHGIKMTRRITPISDLVSFLKLFFYFKKEKFDIVHTYTPKAGVLGRISARLAGVPVVIHTSYGFYRGIKIPLITKFLIMVGEKVSSWFCDMVFSQNQEDISWAISKKIVGTGKIKLLTYGIDLRRFDPSRFGSKLILSEKKRLGIENKKVIGMVGRFVEEKGYKDLFEAFLIIKKSMPDTVLLLVAPADLEKPDALEKSILKRYAIEKDTVLLGYNNEISDVEKIYAVMDVFALPSYREGLSMSLLEAQAMGKPVVATNIRGCRESVENGKTGFLIPTNDPKELAKYLLLFISDPARSQEFGGRGRLMVQEKFDQKENFDKIREEYERLALEKNI
jgi:glycosyltransferase involved in cell wall biosynthesis